ncbi:ent-kaurene synthase [Colletotrichum navitas]|uniref:Ent-kaurene synthase n=1 Tax=Colletotrichum navitas TaxID=681940 RepID=A0AAD8PKA3_9PEZI|nr:ent-kaurene synthase [Colletotrichum navitas]KAK1566049.1 ent-kaurene synthase [Colletotrichum navitas]
MSSITLSHTTDVNLQAARLTRHLLDNDGPDDDAELMASTVYDTAWLALVKKRDTGGQQQWLFPECFQYILETQQTDGGWEARRSQVDDILNTAASLLVLWRHASEPLQLTSGQAAEVKDRVERATAALQHMLDDWDVSAATHVGCEIIVPTLLRLLKEEGASFEFPSRDALMDMHTAKMSAFNPECLYGKTQVAALHHLEAFMGQIDYSRVAHHKVDGGFMRSPSSTAAYLIGLPDPAWDDEAENYLATVLTKTGGKGAPGAFPSTNLESSSKAISTLLQAGFSAKHLGSSATEVAQLLDQALEEGSGTVGKMPSVMADAGDTAQVLGALGKLGIPKPAKLDCVTSNHTRIDPSDRGYNRFGVIGNVLIALLHQPDPAKHIGQISVVLEDLCHAWWKTPWPVQDERNLSPLYPGMVVVQALVEVLDLVETDRLPESLVSDTKIRTKIAVAIFHVAIRTVEAQEGEGSWGESVEETAYAVILLSGAARITIFDPVRQQLVDAVRRAEKWLGPRASPAGDRLWTGKLTYGSPVVTRAYRLAALRSASQIAAAGTVGRCLHTAGPARESLAYVKVYRATPLFSDVPEHRLLTAVIESSLFLPMLKEHTYDVFTRENVGKDKYFTLIPFTWTGCCMIMGLQPSAEFLWELTTIGVLGFQVDEFIEGVAQPVFAGNHDVVKRYVRYLLPMEPSDSATEPDGLQGIERLKPLQSFRNFIMQHWAVAAATPADRLNLARELRAYLLAQIQQAEDNVRFAQSAVFAPATSYFSWARSIATDHIASPLYFAFLACLIPQTVCPSLAGADILPTVEEKYYAEAVSNHSGCMCRIYNDLGSVSRDAAEGNINSLDYPDFDHTVSKTKKEALWEIAQFERAAWEDALRRLEGASKRRMAQLGDKARKSIEMRMKYWRMYCHITDLYGQIWVVRDFSSDVIQAARR